MGWIPKPPRFIRQWDRPDRDPATAGQLLQKFRDDLKILFVDGYILCDPNQEGNSLGDTAGLPSASPAGAERHSDDLPMTITQIAMEQCLDGVEVQVGSDVRRLWGKASKKESMQAMAEMKSVAQDVVRRLDADFSDLDLDAWSEVTQFRRSQCSRGSGSAEERDIMADKVRSLKLKARRLHEALHVQFDLEKFVAAVRIGMANKAQLPDYVDEHWRNRIAWAEALASAQGPEPPKDASAVSDLEPVLRFYWSFRDGTGDVERGLGKFAAMQKSHVGGAEGDISFAEVCLELHQELSLIHI